MFHAPHRKFNREFERRTVTRILAIFSLIATSVLVFAIAKNVDDLPVTEWIGPPPRFRPSCTWHC